MSEPACPACGQEGGNHQPAIRQGSRTVTDEKGEPITMGLIDIGFRCRSCGHEWGFEELGDDLPF